MPTMAIFFFLLFFARFGLADSPQPLPTCPDDDQYLCVFKKMAQILKKIEADIKVLEKVEENVRPVLPTWFLALAIVMGVLAWFHPRFAAAWDRLVELARAHRRGRGIVKWASYIVLVLNWPLSPFRLDEPGIAEMLERTRAAETARDNAVRDRNAAETARKNAARGRGVAVRHRNAAVRSRNNAVTKADEAMKGHRDAEMERDDAKKDRDDAVTALRNTQALLKIANDEAKLFRGQRDEARGSATRPGRISRVTRRSSA